MTQQTYIVRRRGTLDFFAGFAADHSPIFAPQAQARRFDSETVAKAQAQLLNKFDRSVQLKAVAL